MEQNQTGKQKENWKQIKGKDNHAQYTKNLTPWNKDSHAEYTKNLTPWNPEQSKEKRNSFGFQLKNETNQNDTAMANRIPQNTQTMCPTKECKLA